MDRILSRRFGGRVLLPKLGKPVGQANRSPMAVGILGHHAVLPFELGGGNRRRIG